MFCRKGVVTSGLMALMDTIHDQVFAISDSLCFKRGQPTFKCYEFCPKDKGIKDLLIADCILHWLRQRKHNPLVCCCMCFDVADMSVTVAVYLQLPAREFLLLICSALTYDLCPILNWLHLATGHAAAFLLWAALIGTTALHTSDFDVWQKSNLLFSGLTFTYSSPLPLSVLLWAFRQGSVRLMVFPHLGAVAWENLWQ